MDNFILYRLLRFKTNENGELIEDGAFYTATEAAMRRALDASFVDLKETDPCYECAEHAARHNFVSKESRIKVRKPASAEEKAFLDAFPNLAEEEPQGFDRYFYFVSKIEVHGKVSEIDEKTTYDTVVYF